MTKVEAMGFVPFDEKLRKIDFSSKAMKIGFIENKSNWVRNQEFDICPNSICPKTD